MPVFQYRALQADGQIAEGVIEAGGRQDAFRQMEGRRMRPISLTEKAGGNGNGKPGAKAFAESPAATAGLPFGGPKRITGRMLENFTRLLSSLLAAGVPLSRALVILHREAAAPVAQAKWKEIHDLVVDGMSLADAMAKSPDVFPRVYVAMVEAGVVDPAKVVRTALQNAASVASVLVLSDCLITDVPKKKEESKMPGGHGDMGDMDEDMM